ncbi:MAG TPA: competence/damage-inducible protein A [bacterium]|nr:competence/damage-inducible protein A [bacterium]
MKAALVIIGDEILSGRKLDTNSSLLATRLGEAGIEVARIVAVGDYLEEIVAELSRVVREYEVVVATGGLGPTHDDLTRQALGCITGKQLVLDAPTLGYIEERFRRRGLKAPADIRALAMVPEGCRAIPNPAGTVPGLAMEVGKALLYVLPGVPREVEAIFAGDVLRELHERFGEAPIRTRTLKTVGISESDISTLIADLIPNMGVRLASLPEDTGVTLVLTANAGTEASAQAALDGAAGAIVGRLGQRVYSTTGEDLHTVVGRLLLATGTTIATAESCTGGLVVHLLTEVPGISACLDRGVVSYSNRAKVELVGVAEDLIERHGAVSEEVARSMACGARERAGVDLGIATTGIAGPTGGSAEKPVGLVYLALAHAGGCEVARHVLAGDRALIKRRAAARALDMARCYLLSLS